MTDSSKRLISISSKIEDACKIAGRRENDVTLIAISKTKTADEIIPLIEAGQRIFGENRVQEAAEKWPNLREKYKDVKLHLVGQLQSNKAEDAVALFDIIHSLDRQSLVKALAKAMDKQSKRVPCFIQVNIGDEDQKGGCAIADLPALCSSATAVEIPVIGLMTVPPLNKNPAPYFALLAKLVREMSLEKLSMGMSGDFETAIKLGATHVRVGTALFGTRD